MICYINILLLIFFSSMSSLMSSNGLPPQNHKQNNANYGNNNNNNNELNVYDINAQPQRGGEVAMISNVDMMKLANSASNTQSISLHHDVINKNNENEKQLHKLNQAIEAQLAGCMDKFAKQPSNSLYVLFCFVLLLCSVCCYNCVCIN